MGFTVSTQVSISAIYRVKLSDKNARAIGKDYVDPGEKWADEAEPALQSAFESVNGEVIDLLAEHLPEELSVEVEMKPLQLALDTAETEVDVDHVEVES